MFNSILGNGSSIIERIILIAPTKTEGTARKRPKLADRSVNLYLPMHGEDGVSYGRNLELLKTEQGKAKPCSDVMKDLMCRTFPNRWDDFVNHAEHGTLLEYLSQFPLLKKAAYVCTGV